jgi:energy-coupling factor transporter ATP-binding protein EcfA2
VEILRVVQANHNGLVIAAHAFANDGIASNASYSEDFQNEKLLCIEVSGDTPSARESSVLQSPKGSKWHRPQPPACIMSSDAKSILTEPDGRPKESSLGYRFTWIKMSEPSIEALRQAFLDCKSRIRLGKEDPRIVRHSRIESLTIRDVAFLADQEVFFSPGLNCVIGGRGSGKSSLFEYIRFAVRREVEPAAKDKIERIRSTLSRDSLVSLRWREEDRASGELGLEDTFEFSLPAVRARVTSRDVTDQATVFQALDLQIFSQGQISAVTSDPAFLLPLIDRLVGPRLRALQQEEGAVRDKIRTLQQEQRALERLHAEQRELEQTVYELERRWAARSVLQEEKQRHRAAEEAQSYLADLDSHTESLVGQIEHQSDEIAESHAPLGSAVETWPERDFFEALDGEVEKAKQTLAAHLREAVRVYRARIEELTRGAKEWNRIQTMLLQAHEGFLAACARQGLQPQDLEQLLQLEGNRKAKTLELERQQMQVSEIERRLMTLPELLARLHSLWREQTALRRSVITEILGSDAVPKVGPSLFPSVEIRIDFSGDREHFLSEWRELAPDGRSKLGRSWEELGLSAFANFREASGELASPWQVVEGWRNGAHEIPEPWRESRSHLQEYLDGKRDLWESKSLVRIRDGVDLILYRPDGSEAGSLNERQLSDGQRNTAILTLLLARGGGPILIDQPEDELDSSFLYQQLVPLLRKIKEERQVILVTHNPNLPVNADAELVYALSAEAVGAGGARGAVRAQGGLDRETVKRAVLDIMEGSEEAFLRRREKYHF